MSVKVLRGDCMALLPDVADASVDMALCDLPYAVTSNAWDCALSLPDLWQQLRRVLVPGAPVVMTAASPFDKVLYASNPRWFRYEWVWVKTLPTGFLNAGRAPLRLHEAVLVFCDRQPPYVPQMSTGGRKNSASRAVGSSNYGIHAGWHYASDGSRYPTTVLPFAHEERGAYHPTAKPVALFRYLIRTHTISGALVLDPTAGAGTTPVACIREGRSCIAIERDEAYYTTMCRRVAEEQARPRLIPHEMVAQEAETQMSLESVVS